MRKLTCTASIALGAAIGPALPGVAAAAGDTTATAAQTDAAGETEGDTATTHDVWYGGPMLGMDAAARPSTTGSTGAPLPGSAALRSMVPFVAVLSALALQAAACGDGNDCSTTSSKKGSLSPCAFARRARRA
jgi:hypothetical protein